MWIQTIQISNLSRLDGPILAILCRDKTSYAYHLYACTLELKTISNDMGTGTFECLAPTTSDSSVHHKWDAIIAGLMPGDYRIDFYAESSTDILVTALIDDTIHQTYIQLIYTDNTDTGFGIYNNKFSITYDIPNLNKGLRNTRFPGGIIQWVKSGKLISCLFGNKLTLIALDEFGGFSKKLETLLSPYKNFAIVSQDGQKVLMKKPAEDKLVVYNIVILEDSMQLEETNISYTDSSIVLSNSLYGYTTYGGKFVIIFYADTGEVESETVTTSTAVYNCRIYGLDFTGEVILHPIIDYSNSTLNDTETVSGRIWCSQSGRSAITFTTNGKLRRFVPVYDYSTVIGLRYEGKTYVLLEGSR